MVSVFRKILLDVKKKEGKWLYIPVGAVATVFKREIKPYANFVIKSRIIAWDDKWLFVLSRFESPESGKLHAVSLTKYVFKLGRKTVPPVEAMEKCNLWNEDVEKKGREGMKTAQAILDLDKLEEIEV